MVCQNMNEGVRQGPIMGEYRRIAGASTDDVAQGPMATHLGPAPSAELEKILDFCYANCFSF
jgi:hypothetical protein